MERTLVTTQSLRVLLNLEIATLEGCEGVEVQEITIYPLADKDGCNWEVASYSGLRPNAPQQSLIEGMIAAQRYRYNVGRRG